MHPENPSCLAKKSLPARVLVLVCYPALQMVFTFLKGRWVLSRKKRGQCLMTNPQQPVPPIATATDDMLLDPALMEVSDEEAEEEIEIPGLEVAAPEDLAAQSADDIAAPEDLVAQSTPDDIAAPEDLAVQSTPDDIAAPEDLVAQSADDIAAPEDLVAQSTPDDIAAPEDLVAQSTPDDIAAPEDLVAQSADDTTPSVRSAVHRAADILRDLRAQ